MSRRTKVVLLMSISFIVAGCGSNADSGDSGGKAGALSTSIDGIGDATVVEAPEVSADTIEKKEDLNADLWGPGGEAGTLSTSIDEFGDATVAETLDMSADAGVKKEDLNADSWVPDGEAGALSAPIEGIGDATVAEAPDLSADTGVNEDSGNSTKNDAGPLPLPPLEDQTPPFGTNGIRLDEKGYIWIADTFGSQIIRINPPPNTKIVERYGQAQGISFSDDLVIDENYVYWTGFFDGIVGKIDRLNGKNSVLATTGLGTNPIAFGNNGKLLVGRCELDQGLFEVDPSGNTEPRMISAEVDSNAFDLAPDGFLYGPVYGNIIRIDLNTETFETLVSGFVFLGAVRFNPLDGYLYAIEALPASLYRVSLDGSSKQLFATLSENYFADNFAIASDGTFFVTRFLGPVVTRVSADGTTVEDFTIGEM